MLRICDLRKIPNYPYVKKVHKTVEFGCPSIHVKNGYWNAIDSSRMLRNTFGIPRNALRMPNKECLGMLWEFIWNAMRMQSAL